MTPTPQGNLGFSYMASLPHQLGPILLTSFDIWKPHHTTNAADDLLAELLQQGRLPDTAHLVRKLPVDFQLAPAQVLAHVQMLRPSLIICCGMAEMRSQLTVESNGKQADDVIETTIDVHRLVDSLTNTSVSDDAGQFVCNHVYFTVLKYLQAHQLKSRCLFVHVPILQSHNRADVVADFSKILTRLQTI